MWWTPITSSFGARQEDQYKFEVNLVYIAHSKSTRKIAAV